MVKIANIHFTTVNKIQSGWEFNCPVCGYCLRYTGQLKVINIGNPQARHKDKDEIRLLWEELLKDVEM